MMNKQDFVVEPALISEKQLVEFVGKFLKKYLRVQIRDMFNEYEVSLFFNENLLSRDVIRYKKDDEHWYRNFEN